MMKQFLYVPALDTFLSARCPQTSVFYIASTHTDTKRTQNRNIVHLLFNVFIESNPITGLDRPLGFQEVEVPRFIDNRHMKVVRLSALRTGRLYPPRKYSWY
jgi:hypothetical protein